MGLRHSISIKILFGYVTVFFMVLAGAIMIYYASANINKNVATFVDVTLPEIDAIEQLSNTKNELLISAYSLYGTTLELSEFDRQRDEAHKRFIDTMTVLNIHGHDLALKDVEMAYAGFAQELDRLRVVMAENSVNWDQARQVLSQLSQASELLRQQLIHTNQLVSDQANKKTQIIFQSISNIVTINLWLVLSILFIALGGYVLTQKLVIKPVQHLSGMLQRIAESLDLTLNSPIYSADEVGEAAQGTNQLVTVFRTGITDVIAMVDDIIESAESLKQVSQVSDKSVSHLTKEIDRLINQSVSLDHEIDQDAEQTLKAAEIAASGASEMENGVNMVEKTSRSISDLADDLETSSAMLLELRDAGDQISDVVSTIATIADQTNLLALNAAIEAARAGESGRGFAVVADEVRTLATHTHRSTTEINAMLEKIVSSITASVECMGSNQQKAAVAVTLSSNTVDNLSKVRHTILSLSNTCNEVADRAQSVRAEIGNISAAIGEFKTLGNTVSHGSAQTNQASGKLMQTAQQLNGLAAKFKV